MCLKAYFLGDVASYALLQLIACHPHAAAHVRIGANFDLRGFPMDPRMRKVCAGFVAIVCWVALLLQLYLSIRRSLANGDGVAHGIWMYFGFFTILTNLIVAVVLTLPLVAPSSRLGRWCERPATIAGVAVNIALVGIIYNLLLRRMWNPQGPQQLADVLLHDAVPVLFVIYAWWLTARESASFLDRAFWALWPLLYFAYALVRGAATGFYAYPFINVAQLGYARVFENAIGLGAGYFALAGLMFAVDWTMRLLERRRTDFVARVPRE
jgi:hypothetical protein